MSLETEIVQGLLEAHPDEAAAVLERVPVDAAAQELADAPAATAARVLSRFTAPLAAGLLEALPETFGAQVLESLPADVAARYLRRVQEASRAALLAAVPAEQRRAIEAMLPYTEGTAGALMDPTVLAIADDLLVRDAIEVVRTTPNRARYNVYVTGRDDRLVGVLSLRELLCAPGDRAVSAVMTRDPLCIRAREPELAVATHPAWQRAHALPVVDERDVYLGAVRYGALRRLEERLRRIPGTGIGTAEALGELFRAGVGGVIDALGPTRTEARS